jgi:hypothetical protein
MGDETAPGFENVRKNPKGGRPRRISEADLEIGRRVWRQTGGGEPTRHDLEQLHYYSRAQALLGNGKDERFRWLIDTRGRRVETFKTGILAELGRLDDDEQLIGAALAVCELRPTTRRAIEILRRYRTGKRAEPLPPAEAGELGDKLVGLINAYESGHSDCTPALIREALRCVQVLDNEQETANA